jgi:hypothetical protein
VPHHVSRVVGLLLPKFDAEQYEILMLIHSVAALGNLTFIVLALFVRHHYRDRISGSGCNGRVLDGLASFRTLNFQKIKDMVFLTPVHAHGACPQSTDFGGQRLVETYLSMTLTPIQFFTAVVSHHFHPRPLEMDRNHCDFCTHLLPPVGTLPDWSVAVGRWCSRLIP